MPQHKALEKQIDNLTDEILLDLLNDLLRPIKEPGIYRALFLMGKLFAGHNGLTKTEDLNWMALDPAETDFIFPLIEALNPIVIAMKGMPAARKQALIDRTKLAVYGKAKQ